MSPQWEGVERRCGALSASVAHLFRSTRESDGSLVSTSTPLSEANPVRVALVVILGSFMMVLDSTVMNVALPALQTYFSDGTAPVLYSTVAWTVTGYTLAQAAVVPLTDWASKRVGARRLYLLSIALFTVTSLACALSPTLTLLIVMRILQGFAGGCVMPLGVTMLASAAGPAQLGRMMSYLGVPMMVAPILGPVLGGWLISVASWHWIFLINIPFGIAGVVAGLFVLPRDAATEAPSIDSAGIALMCPSLALVVWGVSRFGSTGTFMDISVGVPVIVGLAGIVLFSWRSLQIAHPLLDLRVLRITSFRRSVWVMIAYQSGFFGANLIIPSYFQQIRGLSAMEAGIMMAPAGIGSMLTMPIASRLIDRVPAGRVIPWGMATLGASLLALTRVSPDSSLTVMGIVLFIQGLGLGGTMMPTSTTSLKAIPRESLGNANTVWNIIQQLAGSLGVATVSVVLAVNMARYPNAQAIIDGASASEAEHRQALLDGAQAFGATLWLPTIVLAIGFLLSLLLPMRKTVFKQS